MGTQNIKMLNKGWQQEFEYASTQAGKGAPQWFKLWAEKYAIALDLDTLEEDLTEEEYAVLCHDIGEAFVQSLKYFMHHDELEAYPEIKFYNAERKDGRRIWKALKRDIDQSYSDYEKRVIDGAKGGRPRQEQ